MSRASVTAELHAMAKTRGHAHVLPDLVLQQITYVSPRERKTGNYDIRVSQAPGPDGFPCRCGAVLRTPDAFSEHRIRAVADRLVDRGDLNPDGVDAFWEMVRTPEGRECFAAVAGVCDVINAALSPVPATC